MSDLRELPPTWKQLSVGGIALDGAGAVSWWSFGSDSEKRYIQYAPEFSYDQCVDELWKWWKKDE